MNAFMTIANIIHAVANLLPAIISIVNTVEQALPASGQGATKLGMVRSVLNDAWNAEQSVEVSFEKIWPTLQTVIGTLVSAYNASGVFKK